MPDAEEAVRQDVLEDGALRNRQIERSRNMMNASATGAADPLEETVIERRLRPCF